MAPYLQLIPGGGPCSSQIAQNRHAGQGLGQILPRNGRYFVIPRSSEESTQTPRLSQGDNRVPKLLKQLELAISVKVEAVF
jgi:hypothetical protein